MTVAYARYAVPLALLTLIALIPVALSAWLPRRANTCADPAAFLDLAQIDERFEIQATYGSATAGEWLVGGRIEPKPGDPQLDFLMGQMYGYPQLLMRPAARVQQKMEPDHGEWKGTPSLDPSDSPGSSENGDLPIHFLYETGDPWTRFAANLYAYGNEPIRSPLRARLTNLWSEMREGSQPIVFLQVSGASRRLHLADTEAQAGEWIAAAWAHYQRACGGD